MKPSKSRSSSAQVQVAVPKTILSAQAAGLHGLSRLFAAAEPLIPLKTKVVDPKVAPLEHLFSLCIDSQFCGLTNAGTERVIVIGISQTVLASIASLRGAVALQKPFAGVKGYGLFDWKHGPSQDLTDPHLQAAVVAAIAACFRRRWLSAQCPSLSAQRLIQRIMPQIMHTIMLNNLKFMLLPRSRGLLRRAASQLKGLVSKSRGSCHPNHQVCSTSGRQARTLRQRSSGDLGLWEFDCCAFSVPWKRQTRVLTNTV